MNIQNEGTGIFSIPGMNRLTLMTSIQNDFYTTQK